MQASSFFSDLGIDPMRGGELMKYLRLSIDELADPREMQRFQHVAKFVAKHEDGFKVLKMAMTKHLSPHVNPLDHLESLVLLHEKREELHGRLPKSETVGEHQTVMSELHAVEREIGMYE